MSPLRLRRLRGRRGGRGDLDEVAAVALARGAAAGRCGRDVMHAAAHRLGRLARGAGEPAAREHRKGAVQIGEERRVGASRRQRVEVEIRRDGFTWRQSYVRGAPQGPLEKGEPTKETVPRARGASGDSTRSRSASLVDLQRVDVLEMQLPDRRRPRAEGEPPRRGGDGLRVPDAQPRAAWPVGRLGARARPTAQGGLKCGHGDLTCHRPVPQTR